MSKLAAVDAGAITPTNRELERRERAEQLKAAALSEG